MYIEGVVSLYVVVSWCCIFDGALGTVGRWDFNSDKPKSWNVYGWWNLVSFSINVTWHGRTCGSVWGVLGSMSWSVLISLMICNLLKENEKEKWTWKFVEKPIYWGWQPKSLEVINVVMMEFGASSCGKFFIIEGELMV